MASNHQPAMLRMFIDQKPTSMINVIVRPGTMEKAAIKANGEPHKILRPGEIIKSLEFQVLNYHCTFYTLCYNKIIYLSPDGN